MKLSSKVCCEHDKVAVAEARKMDSWDVAVTNVIDDPQDVHYGPVTNEVICGKPTIARYLFSYFIKSI